MAHQFVLFFNLVGVLLFDAIFLADISVTQNIPATMEPGSEVRVTVTVNKGGLSGFAKLQLDLPPGMTATAIETKGASFTFADQKAKFIWMALPSSPTFKVSYTLSAASDLSGNVPIQGRLSYIEDNERKTYDLPTTTVDMGSAAAMPVAEHEITGDDPSANDLVSAAGGAPAGMVAMAVIDNAKGIAPMQGQGGVSSSRSITPVTENEMLVEVTIAKGDIRGFGKLQETIPTGFTALEKNSEEAIFTAQDRVVKFVWLNLPAKSEIKIVYKLRANERPDGEYSIDGEFGYLLNDETQKAVTGTSKFFVGARALEALAQDPSTMDPMDASDVDLALKERQRLEAERKAQEEAEARARKAQEEAAARDRAAAQQNSGTAQRVPSPEKGITFKVQITAGHREVGRSYFSTRHNFTGAFSIERHQGWIKYVTGNFPAYKAARDQRVAFVQAGHNFPGPFVTAYNNGDRISVQEALAITNQPWVQ